MTNRIIEDQGVGQIASWLVTIMQGSIEIKISNMMVFKPVDKFKASRFCTRAINRGQKPTIHVLSRSEQNCDAKRLFVLAKLFYLFFNHHA
jgi:hypothetical protein